MTLTAEELDTDILELRLISNNIAFAMSDQTLRRHIEAERDRILSSIELIRRALAGDGQAITRGLSEKLRGLRAAREGSDARA